MIFDDDGEILEHYGTPRHSGRYPWGSGKEPMQSGRSFLGYVDELRKKGMTDSQIAEAMGLNSSEYRAKITISNQMKTAEDISTAERLKAKNWSNVAIGDRMGIGESQVRNLLAPGRKERNAMLTATADMLKQQIEEKKYIDFGAGNESHIGVSREKLNAAVAILKDQGYTVHYVKIPQLGTNHETTYKILAAPGVEWKEVNANKDQIKTIAAYTENDGLTYLGIKEPTPVSSKRVAVRYGDEGGEKKDGVIELRRGVEDLDLGQARYAQVRISVDGTRYLKGMAMYSDDLPDGVDILFNTNKTKADLKGDVDSGKAPNLTLAAMKKIKDDPDNPFGSTIRQRHYLSKDGKEKLSPLNIVGSEDPDGNKLPGEEGAWSKWSSKLSSQMMSKQAPALARAQLEKIYIKRQQEYDEIMSLTNPAVKRKLLQSFSDAVDSDSVHLKAAGLPRTANHVILPINTLRDDEIYAPNYENGERVVLIRHPHGGKFEIPELTVNNKNREANRLIKNAADAVGINANVAERLSGADFDGDTVLVIPQGSNRPVKTSPPLPELKGFNPQIYKLPDDSKIPRMTEKNKQTEMGKVSNLITDMTIKGAPNSEIARAVKHSMVVIDAEKHNLNYRQSAIDNGIAALKKEYQGGATKGASTLISKASSMQKVNQRKQGYKIDPDTGEKIFTETGKSWERTKENKRTGEVRVETVFAKENSTKMAETKDARTLSSGTVIETVYADHANRLKALANTARKSYLSAPPIPYESSAAKVYAKEVAALNAKLVIAESNSPLERQAQLIGGATLAAKKAAKPEMSADEIKKVKAQALAAARIRVGAKKELVTITDAEWDAIQAGAISNSKLERILANTDLDRIKELATPRDTNVITASKLARAKAMLASGATQAEVARVLGISTSSLTGLV